MWIDDRKMGRTLAVLEYKLYCGLVAFIILDFFVNFNISFYNLGVEIIDRK